MKIRKLEPGMRGMFVDGTIVDVSKPRTVNTRDGPRSVADATLEDRTGRIKLSLWEDMIERVHIGDEVTISGAYVKEFRGELQLNISRSGTLETQEDRIAEWTGRVKGWIAEDIKNFHDEVSGRVRRRSEDTSYDSVEAKNLTSEELIESRLPDENLRVIQTHFFSRADREYRVFHYTSRRYGGPTGSPHLELMGVAGDEEDFNHVREIFAGEAKGRVYPSGTQGVMFGLKEDPTQSSVTNFYEKNKMHFKEVIFAQVGFTDVPKQVYQDSGLPPERLSARGSGHGVEYVDDDDYEQYVVDTALDRLLRSFVYAANEYRGGEEGFLYFIENSGVIPKGIDWMIGEEDRWPSSVVKRKVREMGEAYKHVIEEMGLRIPGDTKTFLGLHLFPAQT